MKSWVLLLLKRNELKFFEKSSNDIEIRDEERWSFYVKSKSTENFCFSNLGSHSKRIDLLSLLLFLKHLVNLSVNNKFLPFVYE